MKAPPLRVLVAHIVATLAFAGCALLSKSDALVPRYFSLERPGESTSRSERAPGPTGELRLGRVDGASHLEERLVFRNSDHELGYYAESRWTEEPEQYLKRRLARVLFEERGIHHVVGGSAVTLDVQLTAFEEVRAPNRMARVQVTVTLHDQRVVLWEETLTVEQPVAESSPGALADAVVVALGESLRITVDRIADRVVQELAAVPAAAVERAPSSISETRR
jgi:cholesterol transport system auxiliary component